MDLLVVPTIGFRLLYAFVILQHDRRRIRSVAVTSHPTADGVARQIAEAFPWQETPRYLLGDRDAVYGHVVRTTARRNGHPRSAHHGRSPWQNGYSERLVGLIRRECIDHVTCSAKAICPTTPRPSLPTH
jgi:hypothetical protein